MLRTAATQARPLPPDRRARLYALTYAHLGLPTTSPTPTDTTHRGAIAIAPRWAHTIGTPNQQLTGHTGSVRSVAIGRVGDRDGIVSGGDDDTRRIWDPHTAQPAGAPLTGHTGSVLSVAIGRVGDRDVIVSGGGNDRTVRIWDPHTGQPVGAPLTGHTGRVSSVAIGRVGERDVIDSDGDDATVQI